MLSLNVKNETARLRAVVLGTAQSNGPTPTEEEAYDPKSLEHIKAGTYPIEKDMVAEMEAFNEVFKKYDVKVYRPEIIEDYNQIFTRDIGFVIDDIFVKANHIFIGTYKGSDYKEYLTARTNMAGVEYIQNLFPHKKVKEFDLKKSRTEPRDNALHLDCCFQPVGLDKAIIHKDGFRDISDYEYLVNFYGKENVFDIDREEMYHMNSNIFSIAPDVVVSERNFTRLNNWLRQHGFTVEEIPYAEIAKQEGLLRCSTLPLIRD